MWQEISQIWLFKSHFYFSQVCRSCVEDQIVQIKFLAELLGKGPFQYHLTLQRSVSFIVLDYFSGM